MRWLGRSQFIKSGKKSMAIDIKFNLSLKYPKNLIEFLIFSSGTTLESEMLSLIWKNPGLF